MMSKLYAIDSILGVQNFMKDQIVTCELCKKVFRAKVYSNGKHGC